jgi:FkbM family methyltransferase
MSYFYGCFRSILEKGLSLFDLGLVRKQDLERLKAMDAAYESNYVDFEIIQKLGFNAREKYGKFRSYSTSALRQDLVALLVTNFKQGGFFVEFGACDGKFVSNSFLLETEFNWNGILSEPAQIWHEELFKNRSCTISKYAVGLESKKQIQFTEYVSPGLSRIGNLGSTGENGRIKRKYFVESITLNDLLKKYNAPKQIDFISIDTEGGEYGILRNFDFTKYEISLMAVEHNYGPDRTLVKDLMITKGFQQVLLDESRYESWFVHNSKLKNFATMFDSDACYLATYNE